MSFIYNCEENFLEAAENKKVICFGAGNFFRQFLEQSGDLKIDIECVIDNDASKQGNYISSGQKKIDIQSPNFLKEYKEDYVLLITSNAVGEIKKQLLEKGVVIEYIFSFPFSKVYPESLEERKQIRLIMPVEKMVRQYSEEFHLNEGQKRHLIEKRIATRTES